jgi:hypothetical protein
VGRQPALDVQPGATALDLDLGDIGLADQPQQLAHRAQAELIVRRRFVLLVRAIGHR